MPLSTITLQGGPMNVSIQIGDVIYYTPTINLQAGKNHPTALVNTKPIRLGVVTGLNRQTLEVTVNIIGAVPDLAGMYLFFIKDGVANHSGIIGYFLETQYRNYSPFSSEIFATSADFVESSK